MFDEIKFYWNGMVESMYQNPQFVKKDIYVWSNFDKKYTYMHIYVQRKYGGYLS